MLDQPVKLELPYELNYFVVDAIKMGIDSCLQAVSFKNNPTGNQALDIDITPDTIGVLLRRIFLSEEDSDWGKRGGNDHYWCEIDDFHDMIRDSLVNLICKEIGIRELKPYGEHGYTFGYDHNQDGSLYCHGEDWVTFAEDIKRFGNLFPARMSRSYLQCLVPQNEQEEDEYGHTLTWADFDDDAIKYAHDVCVAFLFISNGVDDELMAGYDLAHEQSGTGCGFLDGHWGDRGKKLHAIAQQAHNIDVYTIGREIGIEKGWELQQ